MNSIKSFPFVAAFVLFCSAQALAQDPAPQSAPAPQPAPGAQPASVSIAQSTPSAVGTSTVSDEPKFHFGFKFAPTFAWIKPDSKGLERDGSKLGFSYGIVTEFRIQDNYAFATGLQVTYRGGRLNYRYADDAANPEFSYKLNLQYVEIPITLKMKTNEFGKMRYFGQFGLEPGFNIRSKVDYELESRGTSQVGWVLDTEYDEDFSEYVNSFNLSMIIAAGLEYKLSGSTVLFGSFEFNNGFVDIFKKVKQPVKEDADSATATPAFVKSVNWTGFSNFFAVNVGILF